MRLPVIVAAMSREFAGIVGVWLTDPLAEVAGIFWYILLPVAGVFLPSRLLIYAWMKRTGWRSALFSPTAASVMTGVFLTTIWYFVGFVVTGGHATLGDISINIAVAFLVFFPMVFIFTPIFATYLIYSVRGAYFVSGRGLCAISVACLAVEYVWFRYLSSG